MRNWLAGLCAIAVLSVGGLAHAQFSIGANFLGRASDGSPNPAAHQLATTETAGVVPQDNWNNVPNGDNNNATSGPLIDDSGNVTAVTLTWASNDSWNSDGGQTTPDERLTKGMIKVQGVGNSVVLTFNNVPAGTYDLIATTHTNGAGSNLDITATGGPTYYITEENAFDGTYTQGTSTTPNVRDPEVDYVRFSNLTPTGANQLTLTATWQGGTDGGSISSIQLIQIPEPATLGLLGLSSLGLLLRRRSR